MIFVYIPQLCVTVKEAVANICKTGHVVFNCGLLLTDNFPELAHRAESVYNKVIFYFFCLSFSVTTIDSLHFIITAQNF